MLCTSILRGENSDAAQLARPATCKQKHYPVRPMRKESLLVATAALAASLGGLTARAYYSNTVMALNPVAYWPLNETNSPGPGVTTSTNLGTLSSAFTATFQSYVTFVASVASPT